MLSLRSLHAKFLDESMGLAVDSWAVRAALDVLYLQCSARCGICLKDVHGDVATHLPLSFDRLPVVPVNPQSQIACSCFMVIHQGFAVNRPCT